MAENPYVSGGDDWICLICSKRGSMFAARVSESDVAGLRELFDPVLSQEFGEYFFL